MVFVVDRLEFRRGRASCFAAVELHFSAKSSQRQGSYRCRTALELVSQAAELSQIAGCVSLREPGRSRIVEEDLGDLAEEIATRTSLEGLQRRNDTYIEYIDRRDGRAVEGVSR